MPKTGSGKPLESTVGVRRLRGSRNDAGTSTKLSSRVAKGVGSGEGAVEGEATTAGSRADSTEPMGASGAVDSVVGVGRVASACCGTSRGCAGAKRKLYSA